MINKKNQEGCKKDLNQEVEQLLLMIEVEDNRKEDHRIKGKVEV